MDYQTMDYDLLLIKMNNLLFYMKEYLDKIRFKNRKIDSRRLRIETSEYAKAAKAFRKRSLLEEGKREQSK